MKTSADIGLNRTGIQASPIDAKASIEGAEQGKPSNPGDSTAIGKERARVAKDAPVIGTMPPPGTLKGAAKTAISALKGEKATVFLDKLGERLAFERTGARLYEAALSKYEAFGSWDGGPTEERLREILGQELAHFDLVKEAMETLGGDPTAMTPSADVIAVISQGAPKVAVDPRMNLRQTLEALLVAELADNAGWEILCAFAKSLGQDELARKFENALRMEAEHLASVKSWLTAAIGKEAGTTIRPSGMGAAPPSP